VISVICRRASSSRPNAKWISNIPLIPVLLTTGRPGYNKWAKSSRDTPCALISKFSHLLLSLFCLENIILCLVLLISLLTSITAIILPQSSIILLTFGACEARLGLSIIVIISRSYGSDILNSITINKC